jgi:epoxyqueuosine reductase
MAGPATSATAPPLEQTAPGLRPSGAVARYARGEDYHSLIRRRLHTLADALRTDYPDHQFRTFVDTAPVLEREHALRAGLGWIGRHTLLIHPVLGSWLLLGGIATTLRLLPDPEHGRITDHCGTCTRCIDACPTGAIGDYTVDATRCISYLTIEHRGPIDPAYHIAIGDRVFGCDVCQEVCPHNAPHPAGSANPDRVHPAYMERRQAFDLLEVLGWTENDRREAFTTSAMKRVDLESFKRNAAIAAANAPDRSPREDLTGKRGSRRGTAELPASALSTSPPPPSSRP